MSDTALVPLPNIITQRPSAQSASHNGRSSNKGALGSIGTTLLDL
ncbi:MAG: hypothetical protein U1G07_04495 [Verrucomicrobiota bacterium]